MKKWTIILTIFVLVAIYGLFLLGWFGREKPQEPPAQLSETKPTTAAPTAAPTTAVPTTTVVPTTTAAPTTQPTEAPTQPALIPPDVSELTAEIVFVYDYTAGRLLFTMGDQKAPVAPASLTKLLTAVVALEYLDPGAVVQAGVEATWIAEGSSVAAVNPGNRLTVEMLIEGLLLQSGNDAAYVLAVAAGREMAGNPDLGPEGALERFMEEMNATARELGMTGTMFLNPDGFDREGHVTTAEDLLLLSCRALQENLILKKTGKYRDHVVYESGEDYVWLNTNLLVNPNSSYYCPDAFGLKTGSTTDAGYCLVSAFQHDSRILIVGVLGCPEHEDRFGDVLYLYDHFISQ